MKSNNKLEVEENGRKKVQRRGNTDDAVLMDTR